MLAAAAIKRRGQQSDGIIMMFLSYIDYTKKVKTIGATIRTAIGVLRTIASSKRTTISCPKARTRDGHVFVLVSLVALLCPSRFELFHKSAVRQTDVVCVESRVQPSGGRLAHTTGAKRGERTPSHDSPVLLASG